MDAGQYVGAGVGGAFGGIVVGAAIRDVRARSTYEGVVRDGAAVRAAAAAEGGAGSADAIEQTFVADERAFTRMLDAQTAMRGPLKWGAAGGIAALGVAALVDLS